jgi:DNA-binding transcriptional ArsR family regulator
MAETEYSQDNIAAIRTRLDNLEKMTRLAIAANPNSQIHIAEVFRARIGSPDLYLALENGPKTQEDLAAILGKSQPTVSRILTHLYESGLIDRLPESGRVLWMWHDMERSLGISRVARRVASAKPAAKVGPGQPDAADVPTDGR